MIQEAYCSFEVAKLLKEKGFEILTDKVYDNQGKLDYQNVVCWQENRLPYISAPTHQMALAWLREKGVYITIVYGDYPSLNKVVWTPQIDSLEGFDLPDSFYEEYNTYEEAVEAALKFAPENLI